MFAPNLEVKRTPEHCEICTMLTRYWEMFPVGESELLLCRSCFLEELEHVQQYREYLEEIKSQ